MQAIATLFSQMVPLWAQAEPELLPNTAKQVATAPAGDGSGWIVWLIALALIAGSWYLAVLLSRAWRMHDYVGRFFALIFATAFGIAIVATGKPKLGVDLSGGVILVYELDQERMAKQTFDSEDLKASQQALDVFIKEKAPTLKASVALDNTMRDRIIVSVENATLNDFAGLTTLFTQPGILPNDGRMMKINQTDKDLIFQLQTALNKGTMNDLVTGLSRRINPGGQKEISVRPFGDNQVEIIIPQTDAQELSVIKQNISTAGTLEFRILAKEGFPEHMPLIALARKTEGDLVIDETTTPPKKLGRWVNLSPEEERQELSPGNVTREGRAGRKQALAFYEPFIGEVTGDSLAHAGSGIDPANGKPEITFQLRGVGTNRFAELTRKYTNPGMPSDFKLAILLDEEIATAPNLNTAITAGSGRITGTFTPQETQRVAGILNSGKLPASLKKTPIQEETISAQLGSDTIRSGAIAMTVATASVLIFMFVFYGFCGFVADLCVLLNVLLVLAFMIPLKAALTLSGLAGLVLSVGMAVDANVLIFERIREEVARGSALKMAIRNGFSRAMSTVVDSNLTTLISGVVLFAIGSDQLKGFATTLILGLLLNLFTAVYCSRIIFDVAERRGWFTKIHMMRLVGETKFDFVGPVKACVIASVIIISAGLVVAVARGKTFFDIDFTGGSTVQVVMTEEAAKSNPNVGTVREALADNEQLPDIEVSEVTNTGGNKKPQFKIVTSQSNLNVAKKELTEIFGDKLEHYQMSFANVGPYVPPQPKNTTAPSTKATTPPADAKKAAETKAKEPAAETNIPETKTTPEALKSETPATTNKEAPAKTDPETKDSGTKSTPEPATPALPEPTPPAESKATESKQSSLMGDARFLALAMNPSQAAQVFGQALLFQDDKAAPKSETAVPETKADPAKTEAPKAETPNVTPAVDPIPATPATSPTTPASTAPATTAPVSRYRSQAELSFSIPVSYQYLLGVTAELLETKKLVMSDFNFLNPEDNSSSSAVSKKWVMISSDSPEKLDTFVKDLQASIVAQPAFSQISNIGGSVADKAKYSAVWALVVSMVAIVLYVWFRFQNLAFGFAAVIALIHDVLITIGALAVSSYVAPYLGWAMVDPFKISLEVVAALLTIIGFSINDTIVIFDRVREIRGKSPEVTEDMVNRAVNQTLGRTILTTGTVLMVTIILYIFGGEEIHPFSFAMLIGLISGTYSTVYIAAPIVLWFRKKQPVAVSVARTPVIAGRGR